MAGASRRKNLTIEQHPARQLGTDHTCHEAGSAPAWTAMVTACSLTDRHDGDNASRTLFDDHEAITGNQILIPSIRRQRLAQVPGHVVNFHVPRDRCTDR